MKTVRTNNVHIPQQVNLELKNGTILIGSDAHIWPGKPSTAIRAFIEFCKDIKPKIVILNGDVLDFPQISRHQPIGWQSVPTLVEEIEAAQEVLFQIEEATKAKRYWSLGNHDIRFDTKLSSVGPEFRNIRGTCLQDHFPNWDIAWSFFINKDVVVKHRFKGGPHSPHNNTLWAGCNIITGHLHSQKITPFNDYKGTRYGVDAGCMANPESEQFIYSENNPKNWRAGFCLLTFVNGVLLPPELITVWDVNHVVFRGSIIKV